MVCLSRFPKSMTSHWAVLLALGFAVASTDVVQASGAAERDCFREMERGRGTEIVCEFPTQLTEDEKRDLKAITRDVLQDARCLVSIRIERRTFDEALRADDMVFEASPQPVRCEVVTLERVIPIEARFAPRVSTRRTSC